VPTQDLELLEALEDRDDLEAARAALADPDNQEEIPWEQVKVELIRIRHRSDAYR
jgi:hypothetical protein